MENFEGRPADLPQPSLEGETEEVTLETDSPERTVGANLGEVLKVNLIGY